MRFLLALLVSLSGCGAPTEPREDVRAPGALAFTPPASYAERYDSMQACSGHEGDFARVSWYYVPGVSAWISPLDGQRTVGEWWPPHDIYIAGNRTNDLQLVAHEILHDLLQFAGHPSPPFGTCAPLEP